MCKISLLLPGYEVHTRDSVHVGFLPMLVNVHVLHSYLSEDVVEWLDDG